MVEERYRAFLLEHLHVHEVRHTGRSFFEHLKGTHDLLRDWGNPEPICVAGLFHSIYGTWHFRHKAFPIEQRSTLAELIGKEAEFLAYVFCVAERPKVFLENADRPQASIHDHYKNDVIHLSRTDLSNLLEIEAANLIEQGGTSPKAFQRLQRAGISDAAKAHISLHLANSFARGA
jgi:Domain of unknown function (DUF6817)